MKAYLVTGYDVGGNSGYTVEAVFASSADAEKFALESPHREHNHAFGPAGGAPFEVEEFEVMESFEQAMTVKIEG